MTKTEEIKVLDQAIKEFGPHSYLGPWLMENRAQIVANITSDWTPNPILPGEANRQAREIIEHAQNEAKRIVNSAKAEAEKLEVAAHREASSIRQRARFALENILKDIRG
jgi:cell division septum initiation protein DivIVA